MQISFKKSGLLTVAVASAVLSACNSGGTSQSANTITTTTTPTVYIADDGYRYGSAIGIPNVYQYSYINNQLVYVGTVAAPNGSFVSPTGVAYTGGYVYVVDNGIIYQYSSSQNGNLTYLKESQALPNGNDVASIVSNPNGRYIYAADYESGGVWVYSVGVNGILESPTYTSSSTGNATNNAGNITYNDGFLYSTSAYHQSPGYSQGKGNIYFYQLSGDGSLIESSSQQLMPPYGDSPTNVSFLNGIAYSGHIAHQNAYSGNVNLNGQINFLSNILFTANSLLPYTISSYSYVYGSAVINNNLYFNLANASSNTSGTSYLPFSYNVGNSGATLIYNQANDIPLPPVINSYGFQITSATQNYSN